MASDILSVPAPPPESRGPLAGRPSVDPASDATRLLCAGTYLDPVYRTTVIRELLTHRFRVVAPSYGYDAVPVLAHALAARRLHRIRLALLGAGGVVTFLLMAVGVLDGFAALLLVLWMLWATAFLRRVVTLQQLSARLARRTGADGRTRGFDGSYPEHPELTAQLIAKIDREQTSDSSQICYGGYKPFVGAGDQVRRWSTAELLVGAPVSAFDGRQAPGMHGLPGMPTASGANGPEPRRKEIVPFTVEDITDYVSARMTSELRDEADRLARIEGLAVERSTFTTAVTTLHGALTAIPAQSVDHWQDAYGSGRAYLCIRVGSWNQELVTTAFVGFDLKGSTLHTEFYSYVLGPIRGSFHLVDRLPARLDGRTLLKVAWHTLRATPEATLRSLFSRAPSALSGLLPWKRNRIELPKPVDTSEFGLGRYADTVVNRGALTSIRELASSGVFHVFFQETDTIKYTQIVERQLLHVIRDFLQEHNVDLAEHEARQTNILNYGSNNNFVNGNNNTTNSGTQNHFNGSDGG
ncbi:hypothetical protein BFF78_16305 [Streptomyces fodineus]|uniref:Uncharacterized protein n=1 Tax=Streptomyces fodineus TaxID=1904616 RepID=A0A1D7YA17_9ACTN|nr:hypothetical protein [Streptomyces fodineus]AOR32421.1 hypothetical protein BFF78_16305 [Streptomyces fodineus]